MNRFWSLLFFLVPILGVGVVVWSILGIYPFENTWLPVDISETGQDIDRAFVLVMWIIGLVFVGTGLFLAVSMWSHGYSPDRKAIYTHGNARYEIIWSVIPGIFLIGIFFYQSVYWDKQKVNRPTQVAADGSETLQAPLVRVVAHQFGWRFWYAGLDRELGTHDDFMLENELYLPMDQDIVLQLESVDVLHSFYLRNLRVKQDLVPGRQQYVWFKIDSEKVEPGGVYDILCAELCGWGHSRMNGRLYPRTSAEYIQFLAEQHALQNRFGEPPANDASQAGEEEEARP